MLNVLCLAPEIAALFLICQQQKQIHEIIIKMLEKWRTKHCCYDFVFDILRCCRNEIAFGVEKIEQFHISRGHVFPLDIFRFSFNGLRKRGTARSRNGLERKYLCWKLCNRNCWQEHVLYMPLCPNTRLSGCYLFKTLGIFARALDTQAVLAPC